MGTMTSKFDSILTSITKFNNTRTIQTIKIFESFHENYALFR